jgi:hypothetical protein
MHRILIILLLLAVSLTVTAQKLWQKKGINPQVPVCYASDQVEKSYIPPPPELLELLKSAETTSDIIVSYSLFPAQARTAFEYAVGIWERLLDSPVPIYIQANWRSKEQNVLGSCGPADYEKDFEGAPRKNIYYPISVAEKIRGIELTGPERPDMIAEFNKDINWYFGTDGNTPSMMYDFVSVVLHEIGHGLGFTGFFFTLDNSGGYSFFDWGDATSFDRLVTNATGVQLIDSSVFDNPSPRLRNSLTSNSLYAQSPVAITQGKSIPRLYAPSDWDDGSSIYHLNTATYPPGSINALMTHSFGRGQAIHDPGPLTMGIMADIGWKNMQIFHVPIKDREETGIVQFNARIISDYPLNDSKIYLIYSVDSFATAPDSLVLTNIGMDLYSTTITVEEEASIIQYYISADDIVKRTFTSPSDAPLDFFVINFGPDNILPVVEHDPIPYYFDTGLELVFTVLADDNIAIDTVFIEYFINGVEQEPFGLPHDTGRVYSGVFPKESFELNDNDSITYRVVAIDASSNRNVRKEPESGTFSFKIEKMLEPAESYINTFETDTNDFTLHDFDIYTAEGFFNGALHSPHPYPSPNEDDAEFNFITHLKYPIIINGDAGMSFDEIVLVEPGTEGTEYGDFEFWDYVIVEGSTDKGSSWLPIADGYDSREYEVWRENYESSIAEMNSTTAGTPEWFINRRINMTENGNFAAGDTILIRFRLFSDPYAHGWGWAIDNLVIQAPVAVSKPVLSPGNIRVFPNPFAGTFKIETDSYKTVELLEFDVYNMHGHRLKTFQFNNATGQITTEVVIENGISGMYLLVVKENGKQVFTKKMIHN